MEIQFSEKNVLNILLLYSIILLNNIVNHLFRFCFEKITYKIIENISKYLNNK